MKCLYITAIIIYVVGIETRQLTRCELVHELRNHGFREIKLRDWVCLIEKESLRKTDTIGPPNKDGSRDYGLFQINDHYWCSNTTVPGKDCHMICSDSLDGKSSSPLDICKDMDRTKSNRPLPAFTDLITDDITKATICAKKIYSHHGFIAWHGWAKFCQNNLPNISMC